MSVSRIARLQRTPLFEFEKLDVEITLPRTGLIWRTLANRIDLYKLNNGGTVFNALRQYARLGTLIVDENYVNLPCEDIGKDRLPVLDNDIETLIQECMAARNYDRDSAIRFILLEGGKIKRAEGWMSDEEGLSHKRIGAGSDTKATARKVG